MADVSKLAPIIFKWEGGWADDPNDHGGATMMGVTMSTYTAYCKKKNLPAPTKADLRRITKSTVIDILKTMYWDRWRADEIKSQSIANILVDWVWGSGVYGIKYPQHILQVETDGVVGPKTLAAVNDYPNQKELFEKIWKRRKEHFINICAKNPSQNKYLKGWLNRLNSFKFES